MIHDAIKHLNYPVADLKPYASNPRRGNVDAICSSLVANGQYRPVVANKRTNEVLAGNHTLQAAVKLGWSEIAVTWVDVDEVHAAKIVLVDNRSNDLAVYDDPTLLTLLKSLPELDGTLYETVDLTSLVASLQSAPTENDIDDSAGEPPEEPWTKTGDIWQLGNHRVICGDCRDPEILANLFGGKEINVAFTSPPYATQRKYDESSGFKPIPPDEYVKWFSDVALNVKNNLANDGSWFVNIKENAHDGQRELYVKDLVIEHVRGWGWKFVDEFSWNRCGPPGSWPDRFKNGFEPVFQFTMDRPKFRPKSVAHASENVPRKSSEIGVSLGTTNAKYWNVSGESLPGLALPTNVINCAGVESGTGHVAAFPVALPSFFIKAFSDPGDMIFDPFMGSGTTLIAAHNEDRIGYGVELSPGYVDVICRRWQRIAGELPVNVRDNQTVDFMA